MNFVVASFLNTSKGYIMNTATAAIVEEKMQPITKTEPERQLVVTGQYLYDTFVKSDEQQITKMGIIRQLSDTADALQIKGACDKMVEAAVLLDYPNGKPKKAERLTKEQTAMNARTVIQQAWGALKHARGLLDAFGYDDKTGYQDMRVLAKRALDAAKIKWTGEAVLTEKDKEVAKLKREQKAETQALVEVQKENPRATNESLAEWQQRTLELAYDAMETAREETLAKKITDAIARLEKEFDENGLIQLTQALLDELPVELSQSTTEEEVETV